MIQYILTTNCQVPEGFSLEQAVTLTDNFVTVFHAATADLGINLPYPKPQNYSPPQAQEPILIWGGSSSVGQYALQILSHWGFKNIFSTASEGHHSLLKTLGTREVFDYKKPDVVDLILKAAATSGQVPTIPFVLDCIGSKSGSLAPIARIAQTGSKVAILLPVIVRDASETFAPEHSMAVNDDAEWADGVDVSGVRTHSYLQNEFYKENLQPVVMPTLLAEGIVKPNNFRLITGNTLLDRAQSAMNTLRRKEVSAERLVWKISE